MSTCKGSPASPARRTLLSLSLWIAGAALAGASSACTASVSSSPPPPPAPPPPSGAAIMDWTIDGSKDPAQCAASGATTFSVSLYNSGGGLEGQWTQDCAAFATTIDDLVVDTYTGRANLLDASGSPRTTRISLVPFTVVEATAVTISMDFPTSSFF
jgi:hypothetical protein